VENKKYFDELQYEVHKAHYQYGDEKIPEGLWHRTATGLSALEKDSEFWQEKFYKNLENYHTTLGGRILANAGTHYKGASMLNCFVLGPKPNPAGIDSIEEIYLNLEEQALTLKSEGGWGYNFSHIRPRGSLIGGVGVDSPGAVKFMELFDKSSGIITSGNEGVTKDSEGLKKKKIRKGAMMGILNIWHPDTLEFIRVKQVSDRLSKFNLSVGVTDAFMEAVKSNSDWTFVFPDTTFEKYNSEWTGNIVTWHGKGYPVIIHKTLPARDVWNIIMEASYNRNEPGVFFIDNANRFNNLHYCEEITATNPCGEQPLGINASCLLGSINLTKFLKENAWEGWDYDKLAEYIPVQVRMMDNVVDLTHLPLEAQSIRIQETRRIGLGVLGYGSALYISNLRYGSEEALAATTKLMHFITNTAYRASMEIAKEKGAFPLFNADEYCNSEFIKQALDPDLIEDIRKYGIRNSHVMSIAPTGSTSIYCGNVSGGLEPVFMKEYIRTVIINTRPEGLDCPKYWEEEYKETSHFNWIKEGDEDILKANFQGTVYKIDRNRGLTKESLVMDYGWRHIKDHPHKTDVPVTTEELGVDEHLDTMAIFAKYVDSAVSKTINIPNAFPYTKFKNIYMSAWEKGIKGVTTYRAGTMGTVLSSVDRDEEELVPDNVELPDNFDSKNVILRESHNKWYVFAASYPGTRKLFALFVKTNTREPTITTNNAIEVLLALAKEKKIKRRWINDTFDKMKPQSNYNKVARMISLCLRHGVSILNIVTSLEKVEVPIGSFVFQVRKYLGSFIKDNTPAEGTCAQCKKEDSLIFQEGCKTCTNCGSSLCG